MDAWQQSVEGRLQSLSDKIDSQLKWLLIAFASGFIVLAGLLINRADVLRDLISSKAEASIQSAAQTNERLARVEATMSERGVPPKAPDR